MHESVHNKDREREREFDKHVSRYKSVRAKNFLVPHFSTRLRKNKSFLVKIFL